jgi:hypothetical protein
VNRRSRIRRQAAVGVAWALLTASTTLAQPPRLDIAGCDRLTSEAGGKVCVPVIITTNGKHVASVGFAIEYDPSVLRLRESRADVRPGTALAEGQNLTQSVGEDALPGRLSLMVTPPVRVPIAVIGDGEIANLCFAVEEGAKRGCSTLRFVPGSVEMGDDRGRQMSVGPATGGGIRVR